MGNINIHRIGLMMRKNLHEMRKIYFIGFLIFICHHRYLIVTKPDSAYHIIIQIGLLTFLIVSLTEGFVLNCKSKPNRILLLQTPSSAEEKTIALFVLFFMTILLQAIIITLIRCSSYSIMHYPIAIFIKTPLEYGTHLLWCSSLYALFRMNYSKSNIYTSISATFSFILMAICVILYARYSASLYDGKPFIHLPALMANNFHISILITEIIMISCCWYIIYRRLANTQIN